MHETRRAIVKDIVLSGLRSEGYSEKMSAIRCSKYFPQDHQVIEEIRKISTMDIHPRYRDGLKFFPLREEALKVLKELQIY
jgi:hypothetical protein